MNNVPEGLPYKLSEMWHTLKSNLEMLECYHFRGDIESVTPEIILQERSSENAVNRLIGSVKECADKIATETTLPKEHILHDPPVLIEVCSFISQNGKCTQGMPSAVREYSGKPADSKNPGHLVRGALTIGEALANHTGERPYGILFRQYGQDYDKKVFRRSKSIPYKVFTAVLYINKDGTPFRYNAYCLATTSQGNYFLTLCYTFHNARYCFYPRKQRNCPVSDRKQTKKDG